MGIFDKASDAVAANSDKINQGIDQAGDFVDRKTDNKYADKVDQAQDFLADKVAERAANQTPPQQG